jgi:hypothetical protein
MLHQTIKKIEKFSLCLMVISYALIVSIQFELVSIEAPVTSGNENKTEKIKVTSRHAWVKPQKEGKNENNN